MVYLQTIIQRTEGELIRNIYEAMKADPLPGDWYKLVQEDFKLVNLDLNEDQILNMNPTQYKSIIKEKMRDAAFIILKESQAGHEKGSLTHHENLKKPQQYLVTNKITNKQKSLLFNLRCNSVRGVRKNFSNMYFGDLQCRLCYLTIDCQSHVMLCTVLKEHYTWNPDIKYEFIYGTLEQQIEVIQVYSTLMEVRERLLGDDP